MINIVERPQLTVVFCLPGKSFSNNFLKSWTDLLMSLPKEGITPVVSQSYDAVVYYARTKCLGGDVLRGRDQRPFNGKFRYDYLMWIDSDIVFNPQQFLQLLKWKVDIVSGLYMMQGGQNFAVVKNWDEEFFKKNGYFQFLSPSDIRENPPLLSVDYTGLGFCLIKQGVFESLEYPWFQPVFHDIGTAHDFSSEDVSFCRMIKQKGFKIWVDHAVRVGHEKSVIL